jgi:hypothetical protein
MGKKSNNHFLRAQKIQELYQEHKVHEGVNDKWIWDVHIFPVYFISYAHFRNILGLNVKKKLREFNNGNNEKT